MCGKLGGHFGYFSCFLCSGAREREVSEQVAGRGNFLFKVEAILSRESGT